MITIDQYVIFDISVNLTEGLDVNVTWHCAYKKELDICTKDNIEPRHEQLTA